VPLRSSTRRLIPPVRLLGQPGGAQAGAGREPDPCRSVQISVALGISSSLALALVLDQGGSQASAGPDVEFKRKRYCCSRDALLARQSRMQLGAGHDLEIRPAIVAIMSVNDTRTT